MALPASTDFLDYIFQFPDQGSFQRDPIINSGSSSSQGGFQIIEFGLPILVAGQAPPAVGSVSAVPLLIYNPVENLTSRARQPNALVVPPQQANSSVALPGFWAMITLKGYPGISALTAHPNLRLLNDRTLMFARQPSVIATAIDISHINIVINIFGVYVTDGLQFASTGLLLEDGTSSFLLEDGTNFLLEGG